MRLPWFKRIGIFFLPRGAAAWVILAGTIGLMVYEFIRIDSTSHSVSDTLINFVFNALIIGAVYSLIGFMTSKREPDEEA